MSGWMVGFGSPLLLRAIAQLVLARQRHRSRLACANRLPCLRILFGVVSNEPWQECDTCGDTGNAQRTA